jgi:hypothetical protein
MEGHLVGSDETTIRGQATYRWLPGGFFLEQHIELDFMGFGSTASSPPHGRVRKSRLSLPRCDAHTSR